MRVLTCTVLALALAGCGAAPEPEPLHPLDRTALDECVAGLDSADEYILELEQERDAYAARLAAYEPVQP